MCMCLHKFMYTSCMKCARRRKGIRSPRTELQAICSLLDAGAEARNQGLGKSSDCFQTNNQATPCTSVHRVHPWCLQRTEESVWSSGTVVPGDGEPPSGCWAGTWSSGGTASAINHWTIFPSHPSLKTITFIFILLMCVYTCHGISVAIRIIRANWFSCSTMWNPGIKPKPSGLAASILPAETHCRPCLPVLYLGLHLGPCMQIKVLHPTPGLHLSQSCL